MKALAALALATALVIPAAAGARAASQPYRSNRLHYALLYPASWKSMPVKNADIALAAADRNGFFSMSVANGVVVAQDLARAESEAFGVFGRVTSAPTTQALHVPGATGILSTDTVRSATGAISTVYVFMATYRQRNYTAIGVVRNSGAPGAQPDVAALQTIIRSTSFFP
jgi:hypothetical protein